MAVVEAPPATAAAAPSPDPPPPIVAPPPPPFPPPAFTPPHARPARPEDGTWTPLGATGATGESLLYRATVHPDATRTQVHVTLVAIDLRRVVLHLVAGTLEPISPSVPSERRPGVVAAADLPALIAVMNGGFMTRHGTWGLMTGGDVFLPPHDDGCTVAMYKDGSVRIRTFRELAGPAGGVDSMGETPKPPLKADPEMVAFRQTPPCLVEQGAVLPALLGEDKPRRWGLSITGGVDIRRSALGLAEGGRTMIYGLGEGISPRGLAEAMRAAGAVDVAELDVNWSYTRFFLYSPGATPGAPPEITATLIPKLKHAAGQYVSKPSERDFFYLTRR